MDVLVVGASRGSGAAVVRALAAVGHRVTAYARTASGAGFGDEVRVVDGDVLDAGALEKALVGQDAVVVTLGISDNPVGVRLLRRAGTPLDVRSAGTRAVVDAMRRQGVRRLVVQTTYGLGDSWQRLPLSWKLIFRLLLRPQLDDSARQEDVVRASGLDWTLVRPVSLTDGPAAEGEQAAHVDTAGDVVGMKVARRQVAEVEAAVVSDRSAVGRTLSVSAA